MRYYYNDTLNAFTSIHIAQDLLAHMVAKFPLGSPEVRLAQNILFEALTTFEHALKEALNEEALRGFGEVPPDTGAVEKP